MPQRARRISVSLLLATHVVLVLLALYLVSNTFVFIALAVIAAQLALLFATRGSPRPTLNPIPPRTADSRSGEPAVEAFFRVRGDVADRYGSGACVPPEIADPSGEVVCTTRDPQVVQARIAAGLADAAPVARTIQRLQAVLQREQIEHIFIGGVATMVYTGRQPTDVDLCVSDAGRARFESVALGLFVHMRPGLPGSYVDAETGVEIDMILGGKRIDGVATTFPSTENAILLGGLPVPPVERQVALLLALGREKDVECVRRIAEVNELDERFGGMLPVVLRAGYLQAIASVGGISNPSPERERLG